MKSQHYIDLSAAVPQILEQISYLKLLVLFGSRARGNDRVDSDWDFAILCDEEQRKQYETGGWDSFRIWSVIQQVMHVPDDKLDVVDLATCSDGFAHIIARDGRLLYEQENGEFENFRQKALKSKAELRQLEQGERDQLELELRQWGV